MYYSKTGRAAHQSCVRSGYRRFSSTRVAPAHLTVNWSAIEELGGTGACFVSGSGLKSMGFHSQCAFNEVNDGEIDFPR